PNHRPTAADRSTPSIMKSREYTEVYGRSRSGPLPFRPTEVGFLDARLACDGDRHILDKPRDSPEFIAQPGLIPTAQKEAIGHAHSDSPTILWSSLVKIGRDEILTGTQAVWSCGS
ncbi:hypothetical protein, partial [Mycobacteroides abscessus]|uniref:hypothetical protein n=1 Tax=Mycobacteroides abscessus TaxID=36809 RepID=UPI001C2741A7